MYAVIGIVVCLELEVILLTDLITLSVYITSCICVREKPAIRYMHVLELPLIQSYKRPRCSSFPKPAFRLYPYTSRLRIKDPSGRPQLIGQVAQNTIVTRARKSHR